MSGQQKNRIVLIGLWGLTKAELFRLVQTGELPFLRTLLEEGVRGTLEPALPRYFSVAWATWLSGQNPGRHGVLDEGEKSQLARETIPLALLGNPLADQNYYPAFFHLPSSLSLQPRKKPWTLTLKRGPGESVTQEMEQWGELFQSAFPSPPGDFFAASLDFTWSFQRLKDASSRLALMKTWENALSRSLSPHYPHINLLLLGAPKPFWPRGFSLEKFLEAQEFLKKRAKKAGEFDSRHTLAYPAGEREIKINLKGREPYGRVEPGREYEEIRNKIIQRLMEAHGPQQALYKIKVYKKEELFSGDFWERAPDLLLDFQDRETQGFFAFSGFPFAKTKKISPIQAIDIAPTILYLMQQEITPEVEGRIIKAAFSEDFLQSHPPRLKAKKEDQRELPDTSAEKMDRIIERLKGLGYLT